MCVYENIMIRCIKVALYTSKEGPSSEMPLRKSKDLLKTKSPCPSSDLYKGLGKDFCKYMYVCNPCPTHHHPCPVYIHTYIHTYIHRPSGRAGEEQAGILYAYICRDICMYICMYVCMYSCLTHHHPDHLSSQPLFPNTPRTSPSPPNPKGKYRQGMYSQFPSRLHFSA